MTLLNFLVARLLFWILYNLYSIENRKIKNIKYMAEAIQHIIGKGLKTRREQFAAIQDATNLLADLGLHEDGRREFNGHEGQHAHELHPGTPIDVAAYIEPDDHGATYGVSIYVPIEIGPEEIMRVLNGVPREQWSPKDWETYDSCRAQLNEGEQKHV